MIRKKINIDVFSRSLEFIITEDMIKEIEFLKKRDKIDLDLVDAEGICIPGNNGKYYILIHKSCVSYNTISHEIFHASSGICEDINIEDEETKAWVCGYLSGSIYRHLAEQNITIIHGN